MGLQEDAQETWNELSNRLDLFPYRCCMFAVKAMHARGYEIVAGHVHVDNYCRMGKTFDMWHYWNRASDGTNVDITASQFNIHLNEPLPPVFIFAENEKYTLRSENLSPDLVV